MAGEINYGLLDPNAPAKVAGSFLAGQREAQQYAQQNALAQQQMQQAQTANELGRYQLAQARRGDESQNALAEAYKNAYNPQTGELDQGSLMRNLASAGQGAKIPEIQKQQIEAQTKQLDMQKSKIEQSLKMFDTATQLMSGVKDQAGYDNARQQIAQLLGPEAAQRINPVYNPQEIEANRVKALTVQQQLEQQHKIVAEQLQRNQFAWQQQNANLNRAQSERHFQGTQGLEREKLAIKQPPQQQAQQTRLQDASDALNIINEAETILSHGKATGSYGGKLRDVAARAVGVSTEGAQESAQLKALAGALVAKMPKMSGPQSDKDVALYREMAGQIGDETLPIKTRTAALKTVKKLQETYAGKPQTSGSTGSWKDL